MIKFFNFLNNDFYLKEEIFIKNYQLNTVKDICLLQKCDKKQKYF
jgi:hypothetical protein